MSNKEKKKRQNDRLRQEEMNREPDVIRIPQLEPQTENQSHYIHSMDHFTITFGLGCSGTGKTFCAVHKSAQMLEEGRIDRIVLTRPAVETDEELGFIPGEIEDKYEPYIRPVREIFDSRWGRGHFKGLIHSERIVAAPLAYMRGSSFHRSFVLFDEAQNATPGQMKMFLTRIGRGTKVAINGDHRQSDIDGMNGLMDAVHKIEHLKGVNVVEFGQDDIVRAGIVGDIVRAYEGVDIQEITDSYREKLGT